MGNIAEELTKRGFTTLVDLVTKAGLAETLSTQGGFELCKMSEKFTASLSTFFVSLFIFKSVSSSLLV